jgi:hypothetical protein
MPSLLGYCLVSLIKSATRLLGSSSVPNLYMVLRVTEITPFFMIWLLKFVSVLWFRIMVTVVGHLVVILWLLNSPRHWGWMQ